MEEDVADLNMGIFWLANQQNPITLRFPYLSSMSRQRRCSSGDVAGWASLWNGPNLDCAIFRRGSNYVVVEGIEIRVQHCSCMAIVNGKRFRKLASIVMSNDSKGAAYE